MEFLNMTDIVLLSALLVCLILQLVYYWIYLFKPYKYQKMQEKETENEISSLPPVSIIITGRNKAYDLEAYLPSILQQNYPEYEVIFVNDASTDDTEDVLKRFAVQYNHLYHTYIPAGSKNLSRKKLALTVGIKAAHNDLLLFTEPDSYPVTSDWIIGMATRFSDKKKIVLGFTSLEKYPSKYISYDYFFSNLQMMSLALRGNPYMGNGRNLAYSKKYFEEQRGFTFSNFLDAGEDDLFINQVANKNNVAVELSPESIVAVDMADFATWKILKSHRTITKKFYKRFSVFFWRGEKLSRVLFYVLFIILAIYLALNSKWIILDSVTFLFLLRLFSQLFIINKTSILLKQPKFYFSLPFFDIIQPFVDGYFYFYGLFKARNNYNWKYEKR